jgi:hypothetical protein
VALAILIGVGATAQPREQVRAEHFDRDPGWEGHNNRAALGAARTIRQDFGYSASSHAGGSAGEIGGFITAAAEPAYYAKRTPELTFEDRLTASGTLMCPSERFHVLIGFLNSHTLNEWRTPNTIAIRLLGRGDVFFAYVEYATRDWRAGADSPGGFATVRPPGSDRAQLRGFARGAVHRWSIGYDPASHEGAGAITVAIDDETAVCNLGEGHRQDGATFDHFGIMPVLKSADDGGEVWLDDVTVNGARDDFSVDPRWDEYRNRDTYETHEVRPYWDFGYSATRFAGGDGLGEMGGSVYRGDCRYADKLAYYGDRVDPLTLDRPIRAGGKLAMLRGVSDSTTLIGFFNSVDSVTVTDSQSSSLPRSFVGIAIEGPSREGFFFYPVYRTLEDRHSAASVWGPLRIRPDGAPHTWSLEWAPPGAGSGRMDVSLDGQAFSIEVDPSLSASATRLDRFGIITTWVDGNGQRVYLDDLEYTVAQGQ